MATMTHGSQDTIHLSGQRSDAQPSPLQAATWAIWDTVCSKTFAIGAMVGAALMYAGLRAAQAYLSTDQDTDHPF